MTKDQRIATLQLHKLRVQLSENFIEFQRHQLEFLELLIKDQEADSTIDKAIEYFISYDDDKS